MATEILATGTTAADSSDVTIAAGSTLTVGLKAAANGAEVVIKLKDDGSNYNIVGFLTSSSPSIVITGAGTYRFSRIAGASCGVFSG